MRVAVWRKAFFDCKCARLPKLARDRFRKPSGAFFKHYDGVDEKLGRFLGCARAQAFGSLQRGGGADETQHRRSFDERPCRVKILQCCGDVAASRMAHATIFAREPVQPAGIRFTAFHTGVGEFSVERRPCIIVAEECRAISGKPAYSKISLSWPVTAAASAPAEPNSTAIILTSPSAVPSHSVNRFVSTTSSDCPPPRLFHRASRLPGRGARQRPAYPRGC